MDLLDKSDLIPLTSPAKALMANKWFVTGTSSGGGS
jgi:hypothetical protein